MKKACWKKTKDLEEKDKNLKGDVAPIQSTNQLAKSKANDFTFLLVLLKLYMVVVQSTNQLIESKGR